MTLVHLDFNFTIRFAFGDAQVLQRQTLCWGGIELGACAHEKHGSPVVCDYVGCD